MKITPRLIVASFLVILSVIPYRTVTVPAWRIRFVDELGNPFSSLPVTQTWRNYSVEISDHQANGETDAKGYAEFPERKLWAPLVLRVLGPIGSVISSGVHASFGSTAWIFPGCGLSIGGSRLPTYWGKDVPDRIVLKYNDTAVHSQSDPRCHEANTRAKEALVETHRLTRSEVLDWIAAGFSAGRTLEFRSHDGHGCCDMGDTSLVIRPDRTIYILRDGYVGTEYTISYEVLPDGKVLVIPASDKPREDYLRSEDIHNFYVFRHGSDLYLVQESNAQPDFAAQGNTHWPLKYIPKAAPLAK